MLRAEQVAERVVFVETRPQVQNKAGTWCDLHIAHDGAFAWCNDQDLISLLYGTFFFFIVKEIAIQTEEAWKRGRSPIAPAWPLPRLSPKVRAAPSEPLLQPLLSRAPAAKPKARRKPKDAKKERCWRVEICWNTRSKTEQLGLNDMTIRSWGMLRHIVWKASYFSINGTDVFDVKRLMASRCQGFLKMSNCDVETDSGMRIAKRPWRPDPFETNRCNTDMLLSLLLQEVPIQYQDCSLVKVFGDHPSETPSLQVATFKATAFARR